MNHREPISGSSFYNVIERPGESYTVLSALEDGVVLGKGETVGSVKNGYSKAVSIFAESVTLGDIDGSDNMTFGSTEAEEVTLSTTDLFIRDESNAAVVSARGQDGVPNTTGTEEDRKKTNGKSGHKLNVFVGQAPSKALDINYEARGGHGGTTIESDHAAGSGGQGGSVVVIYLSTWTPILQDLRDVIAMVRVEKKLPKDTKTLISSDAPKATVLSSILGIIVKIERLCDKDDPLRRDIVNSLSPLLVSDRRHTRGSVYKTLNQAVKDAQQAVNAHSNSLSRSVDASRGYGGTAGQSAGQRGIEGEHGADGTAYVKTVADLKVSGPFSFAPLHPLQCQMQIEKAYALLYIGDQGCIDRAKSILSRLSAKIHAVIDVPDEGSAEYKALPEDQKQAQEIRIQSLQKAYEDRREWIGIPRTMSDPVLELQKIARKASEMFTQTTQTSTDVFDCEHNWVPRLSVERFEHETKLSLEALEKTETVYMRMEKQLDQIEKDESLRRLTIDQIHDGLQELGKEKEQRVKGLEQLRDRIASKIFVAELSRRADELDSLLRELKSRSDSNFEISFDSFLKSFVTVAKKTNIDSLMSKPKDKQDGDKQGGDKQDGDKQDGDKQDGDKQDGDKQDGGNQDSVKQPDEQPSAGQPSTSQNTAGSSALGNKTIDETPSKPTDSPMPTDNTKPKDTTKQTDTTKPTDKPKKKDGGIDFEKLKKMWEPFGSELTDKVWEGVTTIPDADGNAVSKLLIARRIRKALGNLADIDKGDESRTVRDPDTGELVLDKERDDLLVASKAQIDKFVEDFQPSKIGPQAVRVQKALKRYADMITERNDMKVQYNVQLKALVKLNSQFHAIREAQDKLRKNVVHLDIGQISQMKQMSEDIYFWNRARTMRLLSLYRRAIYLATLTKPDANEIGLGTSDVALSFPAVALSATQSRLHAALFDAESKAGSDAAQFPHNFDNDEGKCVDLTPEDLEFLRKHDHVRIKLPATTPAPTKDTLSSFRGCADVRVYRVRFWLDGVRLQRDIRSSGNHIVLDVNLTHEGDSVYYDRFGNYHAFTHDPIDIKPSFRVSQSPDGGSAHLSALDNGAIVSAVPTAGGLQKYAAPSPFATWTVSFRNVDFNTLDLSGITKGWFEFFGTYRAFR
ncbi:hypothetical protein N7478_005028 [Penicillium angulare]|uniref:uncharacterized protein n=1 Tax=Penicillium angulare TaxID=116970 RepID=UPI0025410AEE|nr:uncharacterized protein N7478_005028 [Penicillium angulare]KAJ5279656.1 hypothetical protein N7478_005028 [Penicillium angulare]